MSGLKVCDKCSLLKPGEEIIFDVPPGMRHEGAMFLLWGFAPNSYALVRHGRRPEALNWISADDVRQDLGLGPDDPLPRMLYFDPPGRTPPHDDPELAMIGMRARSQRWDEP